MPRCVPVDTKVEVFYRFLQYSPSPPSPTYLFKYLLKNANSVVKQQQISFRHGLLNTHKFEQSIFNNLNSNNN